MQESDYKMKFWATFCSWMTYITSSMSIAGSWQLALTRFWLIYSLNIFPLHPMLSIVFLQECSIVFRKVFWQGGTRRAFILPSKWRAWNKFVLQLQRLKLAILVSWVFLLFFAYRLLVTSRWKLEQVFMTVVMNWWQQHSPQGQWIDTRHPGRQSQKVRLC